ncbi:hypothetical protein B0H11DRAFT_2113265 [Mycena galericulata]|nr:hypothetical protein B0H11DRAFT_2113265 [Mycena galericulata]
MSHFDCVATISLPFLPLASPSCVLPNSPCPPAAHLYVSGPVGGPSTLDYGFFRILLLPCFIWVRIFFFTNTRVACQLVAVGTATNALKVQQTCCASCV